MEVNAGVVNLGDAPVYSVDGIASVELISTNKIRVTYFITHMMGNGESAKRACLSVDWDAEAWRANRAMVDRMAMNHTRDKQTYFSMRN